MSLILDALKKADAERALGRTPGLQAQPMAWSEDDDGAARRPRWLWPAVGGAVLLVIGAAGAWWLKTERSAQPVEPMQTGSVAPPSPRAPEPAAAPSAALRPAPVPHATAPAPVETVAPPPIRPIVATPPPPAPQRATAPPREPAAPASPAAKPAPAPAAATAAEPSKPPPAAASTVQALESLPEGFRRTLPPLNIGGSIHAERPSDRILIVNGQALKEGDTVDGRVTLESIGRQGATWRVGDQRFTTKY